MAKKQKGLNFYQHEKKIDALVFKKIFEVIASTLVTVFLAFALTYILGGRTGIIGDSMAPKLNASDQVLINRFIYKVSSPKAGDVIVFLPYGNTNTHYYTKRVVATPGQKVQIIDGRLYVDGYVAEPDDAYDHMQDAGIAETEITLGADEYFVLGDNRNSSEDSRSGNIGPISKDNIIGKAWLLIPAGDERIDLVQ